MCKYCDAGVCCLTNDDCPYYPYDEEDCLSYE